MGLLVFWSGHAFLDVSAVPGPRRHYGDHYVPPSVPTNFAVAKTMYFTEWTKPVCGSVPAARGFGRAQIGTGDLSIVVTPPVFVGALTGHTARGHEKLPRQALGVAI